MIIFIQPGGIITCKSLFSSVIRQSDTIKLKTTHLNISLSLPFIFGLGIFFFFGSKATKEWENREQEWETVERSEVTVVLGFNPM